MVNPHDIDGLASVIENALRLSPRDAERRMKNLRKIVKTNDVHRWAKSFFKDLVR